MTCEIFQCGPDRVLGEDGAVDLHGRQTAESVDYVLATDAAKFIQRESCDHFGEPLAGGDGRGTAEGLKASRAHATLLDL